MDKLPDGTLAPKGKIDTIFNILFDYSIKAQNLEKCEKTVDKMDYVDPRIHHEAGSSS